MSFSEYYFMTVAAALPAMHNCHVTLVQECCADAVMCNSSVPHGSTSTAAAAQLGSTHADWAAHEQIATRCQYVHCNDKLQSAQANLFDVQQMLSWMLRFR